MRLIARPIDVWPARLLADDEREYSRFSASWSDTVALLSREVRHLARSSDPEVVLQLAVRDRDLRNDGWIRADAKPDHPGVIVSFESRFGPLRYSTDLHRHTGYWSGYGRKYLPGWQANVRAIALGLEALRKVDRYGIARGGEQYRGWNALPPGTPMPPPAMTVEDAARFLIEHGEWGGTSASVDDILDAGPDVIVAYFREAAKKLHPDAGGDADLFRRLTEARNLLVGAAA